MRHLPDGRRMTPAPTGRRRAAAPAPGAASRGRSSRLLLYLLVTVLALLLIPGPVPSDRPISRSGAPKGLVPPLPSDAAATLTIGGRGPLRDRPPSAPPAPRSGTPSDRAATVGPPIWENLTDQGTARLPLLAGSAATWDPALGQFLLFGGSNGSGIASTTYGFAGGEWTPLSARGPDGGLSGAAMAYDPEARSVVLFGGESANSTDPFPTTTWSYANGSWSAASLSPHPSARWGAAMAYDPALGGVALFGGLNETSSGGGALADLWVYRAGDWTEVSPPVAPSARYGASLVYDPTLPGLLLYGGSSIPGVDLSDTWVYNAGNWTQWSVPPNGGPPALFGAAMAFDPDLNGTVLTGGEESSGEPFLATFLFLRSGWSQLATRGAPTDHIEGVGGFDPVEDAMIVADGLGSGGVTEALRAPLAILSVSSSPPNETGATIRFTADAVGATATTEFRWSWGDGTGSEVNGSANATHRYGAPGNYTIGLNATAAPGDAANWSGILGIAAALALTVRAVSAGVDAGVPATFLAVGQMGVPPFRFRWSLPGGARMSGSRVVITLPQPGVANLTVSATDSVGATAVAVREVTVAPPPVPASNATVAADAGVPLLLNGSMEGGTPPWSYQWSFPDGSTAGGPETTYRFASPGEDLVRLEVWDAANYSATESFPVSVGLPPSVRIAGPSSVVPGVPHSWSAAIEGGTGPFVVSWHLSDGRNFTGTGITTSLPSGSASFAVSVVDAAGGHATANLTVWSGRPSPGPIAAIGGVAPSYLLGGVTVVAAVGLLWLVLRSRRRRSGPDPRGSSVPESESAGAGDPGGVRSSGTGGVVGDPAGAPPAAETHQPLSEERQMEDPFGR